MQTDFDISDFLTAEGYDDAEAQSAARAYLEAADLTRPGKHRMSEAKRAAAREALDSVLVRACAAPACRALAAADGREVVAVGQAVCPWCKGSDNRRAMGELAKALPAAGIERLLVVGGTPVLHETMQQLLKQAGGTLRIRCVDGTAGTYTRDDGVKALRWAQLVAVWSSTPLPHKVSTLFTAPSIRGEVPLVTVTQRGIAGLCNQVMAVVARPR